MPRRSCDHIRKALSPWPAVGRAKDSILPDTKRVILEVANFESTGIRRTALRYDTAPRLPPGMKRLWIRSVVIRPLPLSMKYFKELYPELKVTGFSDNYVNR